MTVSSASGVHDLVVSEIKIAAPPERVFEALTDARQLFAWWGKEPSTALSVFDIEPRRGGRWRFRCSPVPGADQGDGFEQLRRNGANEYEAHGEIVEFEPPRLLVWSWIANWHADPTRPTTVRWELTPVKAGTLVRVTHSGLSQEPLARREYGPGWANMLGLLRASFSGAGAV